MYAKPLPPNFVTQIAQEIFCEAAGSAYAWHTGPDALAWGDRTVTSKLSPVPIIIIISSSLT